MTHLAELSDPSLREFVDEALCHDPHVPEDLRARIDALIAQDLQDVRGMFIARCRFGRRFDLALNDEEALWSLVVPVIDGGYIIDYSAHALDASRKQACWRTSQPGLGLERALFEARHDGQVPVCGWLSAWLRANCEAALPIDWDRFALWLKQHRVLRLIAPDEPQRMLIEKKLRHALEAPRVIVDRANIRGAA
jgi:hypothetical protein